MARVLGRVRLSVDTDESASEERQKAYIQRWADDEGQILVGWAVDVGVSGSISPWDTPEFGHWLNHRMDDFDILACWKIDRLSRRTLHSYNLVKVLKDAGKRVKATNDDIDPMCKTGELVWFVMSWLAEGELDAIASRNKANHVHMIATGRWRGGVPPFGYEPDPETKRLRIVPSERAIVERMVNDVLSGKTSPGDVADWLNVEGIRPRKAERWSASTVRALLKSPVLVGQYQTRTGEVVRDKETGLPVQRAEPLISVSDFLKLKAVLQERTSGKTSHRKNVTPLLGVAFCAECQAPLYTTEGYYRCQTRGCTSKRIRMERLHEEMEKALLNLLGDQMIYRAVRTPGQVRAADIAETERALEELQEDRAAGLYKGERGTARYRAMYAKLEERLERLESLPGRSAQTTHESTGKTVRREWEYRDWPQRGAMLRDVGLRVLFKDTSPGRGLKEPLVYLAGTDMSHDVQSLTGNPVLVLEPLDLGHIKMGQPS
ncbi:recombinase family protein [Nonomuraea dietziae]|uniref:recombinase family protein n=1 Tax=Nonomuraea dietziae TaxID=65515 RepID=UPI0033FE629B